MIEISIQDCKAFIEDLQLLEKVLMRGGARCRAQLKSVRVQLEYLKIKLEEVEKNEGKRNIYV